MGFFNTFSVQHIRTIAAQTGHNTIILLHLVFDKCVVSVQKSIHYLAIKEKILHK